MRDDFLSLWNLFSKHAIVEQRLHQKLLGTHKTPLPPKLSAKIGIYPGTIRRNMFQTDLQQVSEIVLEDIVDNSAEEIFSFYGNSRERSKKKV